MRLFKKVFTFVGVTILLGLLTPISLFGQAQSTVTVNLKDVTTANITSRAFVRVKLRVSTRQTARAGAVIITPKDVKPDSNGLVTMTVYQNSAITPSGTFYTFEYHWNGRFQHSQSFIINSSTFDLNNATAINEGTLTGPTDSIPAGFVHTQSSSNATWIVAHNLGVSHVNCHFKNNSDVEFQDADITSVTDTDVNTVTIIFGASQTGVAKCIAVKDITLTTTLTNVLNLNPTAAQSGGLGQDFTWTGNVNILGNFTLDMNLILKQTTADYTVTWNNPAANRDLTIPDPGTAASFLFTEGAQTINGANTFTKDVLLKNAIDATLGLDIDSGTSTVQVSRLRFLDRGADKFQISKDLSNNLVFRDVFAGINRTIIQVSGGNFHRVGNSTADHDFADSAGLLRIRIHGDSDKISFGTLVDTNLYRSSANTLKTDDSFIVGGSVGIGIDTPATSAILDLTSTTGALLPTRMTTVQRDALTAVDGMVLYNSTDAQLQGRVSGAWVGLGAGVPSGLISWFNVAACPAGWTRVVAGLQGRFFRERAADTVGTTGGADTASPTTGGPSTTTFIEAGIPDTTVADDTHTHTVSHDNRPAFINLTACSKD